MQGSGILEFKRYSNQNLYLLELKIISRTKPQEELLEFLKRKMITSLSLKRSSLNLTMKRKHSNQFSIQKGKILTITLKVQVFKEMKWSKRFFTTGKMFWIFQFQTFYS